jgi:hypothetical protein
MNLELDNFLAFNDFKINFSYPKKISNPLIENEYLINKPNFRYKKLIALLGSNATGKTSIGRSLMFIFNFIAKKDRNVIEKYINNINETSYFSIDFLIDEDILYRINCNIKKEEDICLNIYSSKISKIDSYESCVEKLKEIKNQNITESGEFDFIQKLKNIPHFGWLFTFPDDDSSKKLPLLKDNIVDLDLTILEQIIKTLDPSVKNVGKLDIPNNDPEKKNQKSYYIEIENKESIIIKNGEIIDKDSILSSGTKAGIEISYIVYSIWKNIYGFYYCDERFSYIHSDIELSLLNLMIDVLKSNSQLFFTTHNLEILNMNLPIHSFYFLKKKFNKIETECANKYSNKNDRPLKTVLKNDFFDMAPDVNPIDILRRCLVEQK